MGEHFSWCVNQPIIQMSIALRPRRSRQACTGFVRAMHVSQRKVALLYTTFNTFLLSSNRAIRLDAAPANTSTALNMDVLKKP